MCGIVGYIGQAQALPVLLQGMGRIDYRGYDGAGVGVLGENGIAFQKMMGKPVQLIELLRAAPLSGSVGIAHTRWATKGEPSDRNSHPHLSLDGEIAVVHNGNFDNFAEVRESLVAAGHSFKSETDTEVFAHLVGLNLRTGSGDLLTAVESALASLRGMCAVAVVSVRHPAEMVVACRGDRPLILGMGEGHIVVASDEVALAGFAHEVLPLEDGAIARLSSDGTFTCKGPHGVRRPLQVTAESAGKGGYPTYTQKEINDQPRSISDALAGRLDEAGTVTFDEWKTETVGRLGVAPRIIFTACGTSLHAALVGQLLIESLVRVPVVVECASEFVQRNPIITSSDVVIGISQSGETADTIAALRHAKDRGAYLIGVSNKQGTVIPRMVDVPLYVRAGEEYGVASTKAFTSQVAVLTLLALHMARVRGADRPAHLKLIGQALYKMPEYFERLVTLDQRMQGLAQEYLEARRVFLIGRGFGVPLVYEGALKLKEIAYIDAVGYPSGELKHGPLALIEPKVPVIAVALRDPWQQVTITNIETVQARHGEVIALVTEGDRRLEGVVKHLVPVPDVPPELTPLIGAIPLQLFAYHLGLLRGIDVDQPRNLAKSVTVE